MASTAKKKKRNEREEPFFPKIRLEGQGGRGGGGPVRRGEEAAASIEKNVFYGTVSPATSFFDPPWVVAGRGEVKRKRRRRRKGPICHGGGGRGGD